MTDSISVALPAAAPAAPAAPAVKSGWKTTELYLAMFALGGLTWALQEVIKILPTLASNTAMPSWATPIVMLAPIGIGWLMKLVVGEYGNLRKDLKLSADTAASDLAIAQLAGAAQAALPPGGQLVKINS